MDKQLHKGHRQRMRERFVLSKRDFYSFHEHEVLEMLLFFCFPQKNSNEIAHKLVNKFGSIENVLNASSDELCEVENISKTTAAHLKYFGALFRYVEEG